MIGWLLEVRDAQLEPIWQGSSSTPASGFGSAEEPCQTFFLRSHFPIKNGEAEAALKVQNSSHSSEGAVPNTSDGNKDGVRNGLKPVQTCYTIITASRGRGKFTVYNQF